MAIINRYLLRRMVEVIIDVPPGQVQDADWSSFSLDDPTKTPDMGTIDFVKITKRSVLIGEVVKDVLDTNPRKLRIDPLPYFRFVRLTKQEFDNAMFNGDIVRNPTTRGVGEVIGWTELGKTRPSLYYQDCPGGKQPRVDNYFDLATLKLSNQLLLGFPTNQNIDPTKITPGVLQVIGTWNNNIGTSWGPGADPEIERIQGPVSFEQYMQFVFDGNITPPEWSGITTLVGSTPVQNLDLLIADRVENFYNGMSTTLFGTGQPRDVYGKRRDTISFGYTSPTLKPILGECLTSKPVVPGGGDETEDDSDFIIPVLPGIISKSGNEPTDEEKSDDTVVDVEIEFEKTETDSLECTDFGPRRFRNPLTDFITDSIAESSVIRTDVGKNYNEKTGTSGERDQFAFYIKNQEKLVNFGIVDPREILRGAGGIQRGVIKYIKNKDYCTYDIYPNYRDKDGDIPEIVGSNLVDYIENIRSSMIGKFSTNSPLLSIGYGSDGLEYHSDGNSYLELHGESVFGCGNSFALSDIPEIFVEMYPNKITGESFSQKYTRGFDERPGVSSYRFIFEKSTKYGSFIQSMIDVLGPKSAQTFLASREKMLISDVINDIIMGIPDMDFAEIGSPPSLENDIISGLAGAGMGLLYFFITKDEKDDTVTQIKNIFESLKTAFITYFGTKAIIENFKNTEQDLYNRGSSLLGIESLDILSQYQNLGSKVFSEREKPIKIYNYKHYDLFWSDTILSNVYMNNNGVDVIEKIETSGKINTIKNYKLVSSFVPSNDDKSIWKESSTTIEDLNKLQFGLSFPSRWKRMMRPIYEEIWHKPDEIKPENVSTKPYLGQLSINLELGDYDTHRRNFGMRKNLYDHIDDAISQKIHTDSIMNSMSITSNGDASFFKALVDDTSRLFTDILDENQQRILSNTRSFTLIEQLRVRLSTIAGMISTFDLNDISSYIRLLAESIELYGVGRNFFQDIFDEILADLTNIIEFVSKLLLYKAAFINPIFGDDNEVYERIREQSMQEIQKFVKQLGVRIINSVNNFVIQSGLDYLESSLDTKQNSRIAFSPRRVMKRGVVYLQSKSGLYTTNRQPCPIIFLGFNDKAIMSTFSNTTQNGLKCLNFLSKSDSISYSRQINVHAIKNESIKPSYVEFLNPNLGTLNVSDINLPGEISYEAGYSRYSRIDNVPTINKRIRQYGKNPFLDIFYLNIIPDSLYSIDSENWQKNSKINLSATPPPFRYPTLKNIRFSKPLNSNVPSIFPPWWNEPVVREELPEARHDFVELDTYNGLFENTSVTNFSLETYNWNLGDYHFFRRRRNNILRAKDRWSMSLESISGDTSVVVLKDKTPILDIYFGLLNMHVFGIGWDIIVPFINRTKDAVKIASVFDNSVLTTMPDEENPQTKIDLNELEKINKEIQSYLKNGDIGVSITGNTNWGIVSPNNETPVKYVKNIEIYNNSFDSIEIPFNEIKITSVSKNDKFGQSPNNLFYVGNISFNKTEIEVPPVYSSGVFETIKMDSWSVIQNDNRKDRVITIPKNSKFVLEINFVPFRAESENQYIASIDIPFLTNSSVYPDQKIKAMVSKELVAVPTNKPYTLSIKSEFISDLELPYAINFGEVNDIYDYIPPIDNTELNHGYRVPIGINIEEDILIRDFKITNNSMLNIDGKNFVDEFFKIKEPRIFCFSRYDSDSYNFSSESKIINDKTFLEEFYQLIEHKKVKIGSFIDNFGPVVQIDYDSITTPPKQTDIISVQGSGGWHDELNSGIKGFKLGNLVEKTYYTAKLIVNYELAPRLNSSSTIRKSQDFLLEFVSA